jgi:hypothetical protein
MAYVLEDVQREHQANLGTLQDIKARLSELSREYRDGMVSDKPVAGALDQRSQIN